MNATFLINVSNKMIV